MERKDLEALALSVMTTFGDRANISGVGFDWENENPFVCVGVPDPDLLSEELRKEIEVHTEGVPVRFVQKDRASTRMVHEG